MSMMNRVTERDHKAKHPNQEAETLMDAFRAHLDECEQCERHPFELCVIGYTLLIAAGNIASKGEK